MNPRGLSRSCAAEYVGCSPRKFDQMILNGLMPAPRLIGTKKIWDRVELDEAFEELPREVEGCEWDVVISSNSNTLTALSIGTVESAFIFDHQMGKKHAARPNWLT